MKKIALIYMGGTFGCIGDPLSPMLTTEFEPLLKKILPHHLQIDFFSAPTIKDSSACTPADWFELIQQIQNLQLEQYAHFIVIHGTDTLSYAASTLSQFLQHSCHVVLTGSQYPLLNIEGNDLRTFTDALENLNTAIDHVFKVPCGVYVAFHHKVMHANSIHKIHTTSLDAFHGLDYHLENNTAESASFNVQHEHIERVKQLKLLNIMLQPIELNHFAQHLENLIDQDLDVLIIQGYGTGNIAVNDEILKRFKHLQDQNCCIILDTQVPFGGIDQRYAVSQWIIQSNILVNNTQSHADLYAKVLKMYLQYPSKNQWRDHWYGSSK